MEKLTLEDKIMGIKEPRPLTECEKTALTDKVKYEINLINLDNKSIVTGAFLDNILNLEAKKQLRAGEKEIEAGGFHIVKIEKTEKETKTEPKIEKPKKTTKKIVKKENK